MFARSKRWRVRWWAAVGCVAVASLAWYTVSLSQTDVPWIPPKTIVFQHLAGGGYAYQRGVGVVGTGAFIGYFRYNVTNTMVWHVGVSLGPSTEPKNAPPIYPFLYAIPGVSTNKEVAVRTKLFFFEAVSEPDPISRR